MRVITEIVGGIALLAIFAYGVAYIIDIVKHMEPKNGKSDSPTGLGSSTEEPTGGNGDGGAKPH